MWINLNVTQDIADVLVSSYPSILADGAEQCETIGHCRTVWNIIWSCLITIFACIWVAVHPNFPQPKPPFTPTQLEGPLPRRRLSWTWVCFQALVVRHYLSGLFRRQLPGMLTALGEKLAIALLALLAPEFIFVWALRQWLRARSIAEECRAAATTTFAREARTRRNILTSPLVVADQRAQFETLEAMGYDKRTGAQKMKHYNLRMRLAAAGKEDTESSEQYSVVLGDSQTNWTTTHGFFILMGGFHQYDGDKPLVYLLPNNVVSLISEGLLTPPSEEEIKDRSKADSFSKLIVLVQTLWFVMQCIARHIEHLPITELEVATLAYTIPILGIYICWWNKPLGVTQPIRISKSIWDGSMEGAGSFWRSFTESLTGFENWSWNRPRVPSFSAGGPSEIQIDQADIVTLIITVLFGAVHCFAWFFHFPSETERLLWHIASVLTTASPIIWTVLYTLFLMDATTKKTYFFIRSFTTINTVSVIVVPFYLVGRIILLVLAFVGLRSLTPAAYQTVYWTTFIPHI